MSSLTTGRLDQLHKFGVPKCLQVHFHLNLTLQGTEFVLDGIEARVHMFTWKDCGADLGGSACTYKIEKFRLILFFYLIFCIIFLFDCVFLHYRYPIGFVSFVRFL